MKRPPNDRTLFLRQEQLSFSKSGCVHHGCGGGQNSSYLAINHQWRQIVLSYFDLCIENLTASSEADWGSIQCPKRALIPLYIFICFLLFDNKFCTFSILSYKLESRNILATFNIVFTLDFLRDVFVMMIFFIVMMAIKLARADDDLAWGGDMSGWEQDYKIIGS